MTRGFADQARAVTRATIEVDHQPASYLTAGAGGPVVLLLHGTYWSRVWQPVLPALAAAGLRPIAVDLPGLGRSGGELTLDTATVPALAGWVARFVSAVGVRESIALVGHDIGGAIAQRLLVENAFPISRLALVNAVMYDSWPVPGVAKFRDPAIVAATTSSELLEARRRAITTGLALPAADEKISEYLEPFNDPRVRRSWMALAGAADARYTVELLPALRESHTPKLLVWGEDDVFQKIGFAERFAAEIPNTSLVRIPSAGHVPMENDPQAVAHALASFLLS
jgi:pimeloyl-ACP methyl ester carboxylesterase